MNMPFPGMDPYLAHPALWPGVHARLIVALAAQLSPRIQPRYVVSIEDRVFLETPYQQRIPDVWLQKLRDHNKPLQATTAPAAPIVVEAEELEVHEHYLEILDLYRDQRVVTVIELVSPTNKAAGPGCESYWAISAWLTMRIIRPSGPWSPWPRRRRPLDGGGPAVGWMALMRFTSPCRAFKRSRACESCLSQAALSRPRAASRLRKPAIWFTAQVISSPSAFAWNSPPGHGPIAKPCAAAIRGWEAGKTKAE
jgi:Protein of unknown function (DUF4058)